MTTMTMRKPHGDRPIEGLMAKWYANNTGEMMKEYLDLARRVAEELPKGSSVLEVAPGPKYRAAPEDEVTDCDRNAERAVVGAVLKVDSSRIKWVRSVN